MKTLNDKKTHQLEFVVHVLPSLFHNSPEQFLYYLSRDGNKFLNFYWEEAGRKIGIAQPVSSFELNYVICKPKAQTVVALITLPIPQTLSEANWCSR